MPSDVRVIFDTNTVVSALLLPTSLPRQALRRVSIAGQFLVSASTITELTETLRAPKFDRYLTEADRFAFLAALLRDADFVDVTATVTDCRDPKDNKFLELAVSGQATHLLTGDQDLLVLHPFRGTAILTCRQFLSEAIPS